MIVFWPLSWVFIITNEDSLSSTSAGIMGTTGTLASEYCILPIKSRIDGIGWNEQYRERLEEFVNIIHTTIMHVCSLSKFIFLCALQDDASFDIASYDNKEFVSEVWSFLISYRRGRVGETTARRHTLIGQYKDTSIILLMKGPNSNMLNNHLQ
ncbi:hypothetical protein G6F43_010993 [Rhizopus delemar]|nr:hypothetical protein G6F43_010993 [Rhizopus delemar]